jgi:hypothetical protein
VHLPEAGRDQTDYQHTFAKISCPSPIRNRRTPRYLNHTMSDHLEDGRDLSRDESTGSIEFGRRKQQSQQPRQLLSCTKCRERKVKVRVTAGPTRQKDRQKLLYWVPSHNSDIGRSVIVPSHVQHAALAGSPGIATSLLKEVIMRQSSSLTNCASSVQKTFASKKDYVQAGYPLKRETQIPQHLQNHR